MRRALIDEEGWSILKVIETSGADEDDFQWFNFPASGREGLGLFGAELDEFVGLCIKAALKDGCIPVNERPDGNWRPTYAYGITDEEIAANLVAAWHALGRDPEWGELMFSWKTYINPAAYAEWERRRKEAGAA